jgi:hypothetical protein
MQKTLTRVPAWGLKSLEAPRGGPDLRDRGGAAVGERALVALLAGLERLAAAGVRGARGRGAVSAGAAPVRGGAERARRRTVDAGPEGAGSVLVATEAAEHPILRARRRGAAARRPRRQEEGDGQVAEVRGRGGRAVVARRILRQPRARAAVDDARAGPLFEPPLQRRVVGLQIGHGCTAASGTHTPAPGQSVAAVLVVQRPPGFVPPLQRKGRMSPSGRRSR